MLAGVIVCPFDMSFGAGFDMPSEFCCATGYEASGGIEFAHAQFMAARVGFEVLGE